MKQEIIFTENAIKHYNGVFGCSCYQSKILRKKLRKLKRWQQTKDSIDKKYKKMMLKFKKDVFNML